MWWVCCDGATLFLRMEVEFLNWFIGIFHRYIHQLHLTGDNCIIFEDVLSSTLIWQLQISIYWLHWCLAMSELNLGTSSPHWWWYFSAIQFSHKFIWVNILFVFYFLRLSWLFCCRSSVLVLSVDGLICRFDPYLP